MGTLSIVGPLWLIGWFQNGASIYGVRTKYRKKDDGIVSQKSQERTVQKKFFIFTCPLSGLGIAPR